MIIDNSEQGSQEWFEARAGVVTASNFRHVLAFLPEHWAVIRPTGTTEGKYDSKNAAQEALQDASTKSKLKGDWKVSHVPPESLKTRTDLMKRLATEIITGRPIIEPFKSYWMERGNEIEDQARAFYELRHPKHRVTQVGLTYLNGRKRVGASLDGLVNDNGAIEIKCPKLETHLDYLIDNKVPDEYVPQVQGQLWVSQREFCDFVSFHPDSHIPGIFIRAERDEKYIRYLKKEVYRFIRELDELVETYRNLATRKAA